MGQYRQTSFYNKEEINDIGFKSVGENVSISRYARIYNAGNISIGSNVRVDDFCILSAGSGGIEIGNNVHIAAYSSLMGKGKIKLYDFVGLSSRVAIYSSSDDYMGEYMTNPTVPAKYIRTTDKPVIIKEHAIIGSGCVVLEGAIIGEGVAIGALSLIRDACDPFWIYNGSPATKVIRRSKSLLKKAKEYEREKR